MQEKYTDTQSFVQSFFSTAKEQKENKLRRKKLYLF